ncbi:hypothetical protein E8E11_004217 [Didymella keratinophila]|nr:hypothetical protein E8E11_004217 [Didymella keratinophila]
MNVNTTTSLLTPSITTPVPAAIQLTVYQLHFQSLARSTALCLTPNASLLRGLRLEENWLCLRERSLAELTRLNEVGEKILRLEDQSKRDERDGEWHEEVWAATIEHEKKKARGEVA